MTTSNDDRAHRQSKGERTRAELLDAARQRFGTADYGQVTISAVARDVGVSPAASYAYFSDKTALFTAALDADLDEWIDTALPAAVGDRPMFALFIELVASLDRFPVAARVLRGGDAEQLQHVLNGAAMTRLRAEIESTIALRQQQGSTATYADASTLAAGIETLAFALVATISRTGLFEATDRVEGVVAILQAALGSPDGPLPDFRSTT